MTRRSVASGLAAKARWSGLVEKASADTSGIARAEVRTLIGDRMKEYTALRSEGTDPTVAYRQSTHSALLDMLAVAEGQTKALLAITRTLEARIHDLEEQATGGIS